MKNTSFLVRAVYLVIACAGFYACKKDLLQQPGSTPMQTGSVDLTTATTGRTLSANCFQCHGTNGHTQGEMALAGMHAQEIISEINEMKAKNPGSNIMNVHAQAYTDIEIQNIANFFSKQ